MTHTYRTYLKVRDGASPFWFNHDPKKVRRKMNRAFRYANKRYFERFMDVQYRNPAKSRGYNYW